MCLSESIEGVNETSVNVSTQLIEQENHIYKIPASFEKKFKYISANIRIEAKHLNLKQYFKITLMRSKLVTLKE